MKKNKQLLCRKCGHKVGVVTVRPVFKRKLLMYGLLIALALQIVAELFVDGLRLMFA